MFSDATFAIFRFPTAGFILRYFTEVPRINTSAKITASLAPYAVGTHNAPPLTIVKAV